MRTPGLPGITSIECPGCGTRLQDYDAPHKVNGFIRLLARCHKCRTQQLLEVDQGEFVTSVVSIARSAWSGAA